MTTAELQAILSFIVFSKPLPKVNKVSRTAIGNIWFRSVRTLAAQVRNSYTLRNLHSRRRGWWRLCMWDVCWTATAILGRTMCSGYT
jgi:hypothetical protein